MIQMINQIKPQGQEPGRTHPVFYSTEFWAFRLQDHLDDEVDLFSQYAFCGFVLTIPLCVHPPPTPLQTPDRYIAAATLI